MASRLNQDVLRIILELAALDDRSLALRFTLLSRRISTWMDPIIYNVVTLDNLSKSLLFLRTIQSSSSTKPPSFFATHVKSLCITSQCHPEPIAHILSACTGVQSLACWIDATDAEVVQLGFPALLANTRPTRLSIHLSTLLHQPRFHFEHACLTHVTHLHIPYDSHLAWDAWEWGRIKCLPHLLHVRLSMSDHWFRAPPAGGATEEQLHLAWCDAVRTILRSSSPLLRACAVRVIGSYEMAAHPRFHAVVHRLWKEDKRVVVIYLPRDVCDDWHAPFLHRPHALDGWAEAERLVALGKVMEM
jgi:hypothetical protein